jgi:hypothetical protein
MNRIRVLGMVLLWAGFLAGALAAVQNVDPPGRLLPAEKWKMVNWWWYGGAFLIGAVGVGLIWSTRKPTARRAASFDALITDQRRAVESLIATLGQLQRDLDQSPPSKILAAIDQQCSQPLADFAEARQALSHRYGLKHFAAVMTDFALAERYINRAWSAAADGYLDEVRQCLEVAARSLDSLAKKYAQLNARGG